MGSAFPQGTVTFLFTDIEGSTRLRQAEPEAYIASLAQHNALLRQAIEGRAGLVFKIIGDALCAAFATAPDALHAALDAQQALHAAAWGSAPVRVRMALHTGAAEFRDGDYWGFTLARLARLLPAGHGGQVLLSQATADLLADELPAGVALRDLGAHRLKDLVRAEHVYQATAADMPRAFPPLKSLNAFPHNLPVQLTSFIGREKELADVKRLLAVTRLLTLVGPGGTGKTRVSLQAAAEALELFADGAWLVELAPLADPGLIPQTVAAALGLRESGGRPMQAALEDYLRGKTLLLVLDNCEHLLDACARLADALLHAAPNVRILASSREGLGIAGETTYRVPSLALPDLKQLPPFERLSQYEAVRLFVERAVAALPGFAVTNANAPALAQICAQLDGIPLAIELAASRVRALSPEQLMARLSDRFRLLTGGSRTALPRHQTLRAAIDWSHDLLSADEQTLLRRLSVFVGGWTLEAAEQVCAGSGLEGAAVYDLLDALVNKSLVGVEPGAHAVRYGMLETVRQYAHEMLLDAGEAEMVRNRHLALFLEFAEQAEPRIRSAEQLPWLARLDTEQGNLRTALAWALETAPADLPEAALRLTVALTRYHESRGHEFENKTWLERALAQGPATPSAARARALDYYAWIVGAETWDGQSAPFYEQAMVMAKAVGDIATQGHLHMMRAHLSPLALDDPRHPYARALKTFEGLGDNWSQANTYNHLSQEQVRRGNLAGAEASMQQALTLWRQTGDRSTICHALCELADIALLHGEVKHAQALIDEALPLAHASGHTAILGDCLHVSAQIEYCRADYALMRQHYQQYQAIKHRAGDKVLALAAQQWQGVVRGIAGDYDSALRLQTEALAVYREMDAPFLVHWSETMLAFTHLERGEAAQAKALAERTTQYFSEAQRIPDLCRAQWCLGMAHYHLGESERAGAVLAAALQSARESQLAWAASLAHYGLGRVALAQGDPSYAEAAFRESLALCQRMGARREIAELLEGFAALALNQQLPQRAARLLGAAEALREEIGAPVPLVERDEHERVVAGTRAAVEPETFEAAWSEGRAMGWEQATDFALIAT